MQTTLDRWGFLGSVALLFILSLFLPALGNGGQPTEGIPGIGALFGAILLLTHPSAMGEPGALPMALSVLANPFLLCGWVFLAISSRRFPIRGVATLRVWGLLSFVLALTPLFCVGVRHVLVGYYLWVVSIGLLTGWFWIRGLKTQTSDPSVVTVPRGVGGSNPAEVG